jgi:hypothetical protein
MAVFKTFVKVMIPSLPICRRLKDYLISWLPQDVPSPSPTSTYMCLGAFTMNFVTWLLVYLQNLILYHILSCMVIYLLMSFYIGAPFILFLWLHRYYQHLCNPPSAFAAQRFFLVLMATVHPFNVAEVDAMGGGI